MKTSNTADEDSLDDYKTYKTALTVLCTVIKHPGSDKETKKC